MALSHLRPPANRSHSFSARFDFPSSAFLTCLLVLWSSLHRDALKLSLAISTHSTCTVPSELATPPHPLLLTSILYSCRFLSFLVVNPRIVPLSRADKEDPRPTRSCSEDAAKTAPVERLTVTLLASHPPSHPPSRSVSTFLSYLIASSGAPASPLSRYRPPPPTSRPQDPPFWKPSRVTFTRIVSGG